MRERRIIPQYCNDQLASKEMARRIQNYWRKRGYDHVKVWEEEDTTLGRALYVVRSNIVMSF